MWNTGVMPRRAYSCLSSTEDAEVLVSRLGLKVTENNIVTLFSATCSTEKYTSDNVSLGLLSTSPLSLLATAEQSK